MLNAVFEALRWETGARKLLLVRELLTEKPEIIRHGALGLLRDGNRNDADLALSCLTATALTDEDELHQIQMELGRLADNAAPMATSVLMHWGYEHGPCAECREELVGRLLQLGALEDALREECTHDACNDVRKLAGVAALPHSLGFFK